MKTTQSLALFVLVSGLLSAMSVNADIVFSYEAPGVQQTTVAGAVTETFDSLTPGVIGTYVSPTIGGTYSSGQIVLASEYGGAGGSGNYDVVGIGNTTSQTLTFTDEKTYFGMWWSAGDAANQLQFYNSGTLVGSFKIGDIIPYLSSAYYGNPNSAFASQDPYEPFVYLNFTVTGGTLFNEVVFNNPSSSGFENDNQSVYDQVITPPGTIVGVPEPTTLISGGFLMLPFGLQTFRLLRTYKRHW